MGEKKLVKFLLLVMLSELLIFPASEAKAWWSRRRRACPSSRPTGVNWVNTWKQDFTFTCPKGRSVSVWRSEHRNCKEDRIHFFKCRTAPVRYKRRDCSWSHHVNDLDRPLVFKCPHNGFITGIKSHHGGGTNDRRFLFRCCHVHKYTPKNCDITRVLNQLDQPLYYKVPPKYSLVGAFSDHENYYEDRRWQFEICQFSKCKGK